MVLMREKCTDAIRKGIRILRTRWVDVHEVWMLLSKQIMSSHWKSDLIHQLTFGCPSWICER